MVVKTSHVVNDSLSSVRSHYAGLHQRGNNKSFEGADCMSAAEVLARLLSATDTLLLTSVRNVKNSDATCY
jgi:hypothetical protein